MNFFRCQICGDVYIGPSKPGSCPYCGSKAKYLVPVAEWIDENTSITSLSDVSRGNLEKALQLEVNNSPFYRDASAKAKGMELQGIFKGLAKIEGEHASVLRKILNCDFPAPEPHREKATDDDMVNLKTAHERERIATDFYMMSAERAVEPRVKKVFTALSEIESDHIRLEEDLLNGHGV